MEFPSISIQGNIISWEIVNLIKTEAVKFQKVSDFGFGKNAYLRDEIGSAWAILKNQYNIFKIKQSRLSKDASGTPDTCTFWMIPFLQSLGYEPEKTVAEMLNEKSYPISHRDNKILAFPLHIAGCNESIDRKPASGTLRISPHGLVQEYLNATPHLYGLVTNGLVLRLLRDATSLVKLNYLQFDLVKMFEDDLYADFAILFRLIHVSRMPKSPDEGEDAVFENYHQQTLDTGTRIRDKLSQAVAAVIIDMAAAIIKHDDNEAFIELIKNQTYSGSEFYHDLLRFVYRFLFVTVIEERKLIFVDDNTEKTKRLRDIYYRFYSLKRIRQLASRAFFDNDTFSDLWMSMSFTFSLFEPNVQGKKLNINPLMGDLFSEKTYTQNLGELKIYNSDLLRIIRKLTVFQNEQNITIPINYADLNVEEFGSVYEGLLERTGDFDLQNYKPVFRFRQSSERSSSGSHYTPDELVQPLIKHSLDYLIADKLKLKNREQALLSLKVCDVACGSGHILLSAARRIGLELARVRTAEEQPSPEAQREGIRDAIANCIYGVDKNPMAVELCKISLWLEAHIAGKSLRFLDHRIKCGDSIVGVAHLHELENGIASEALKTLPNDDKNIAKRLRESNNFELRNRKQGQTNLFAKKMDDKINALLQTIQKWQQMPEDTPEQQTEKKKRFAKEIKNSDTLKFFREIADLQTAPFFIPKTEQNKNKLITDSAYFQYIKQEIKSPEILAMAETTAQAKQFFHWFVEFPEVFLLSQSKTEIEPTQTNLLKPSTPQSLMSFGAEQNPLKHSGFDCILGNPPFLGGQRLSGMYGTDFLEYMKYAYAPAGSCDLVTYFFRRIFNVLKINGFQSLIATNTIAQGAAREGGLDVIVNNGGSINHAVRSMRWPGVAAVEVALVTIHKGKWNKDFVLKNKSVKTITPYLDDAESTGNPFQLIQNQNKSFQGSIVLGQGFVLEPHEAQALIDKNAKNNEVLFPYLNGEDLNSNPDQSPSRWVINFFDYPLRRYTSDEWRNVPKTEKDRIHNRIENHSVIEIAPPHYENPVAADYPDCLEIVELKVKPQRQKDNREQYRKRYWQHAEKRIDLYLEAKKTVSVLLSCRVSKYVNHSFTISNLIYDVATNVIASDSNFDYSMFQNSIHIEWAWKYASTLESRIRYTNGDCIDTFPFPQTLSPAQESKLEQIGEQYHEHRRQLMLHLQLGLTKTYNQFHNSHLEQLEAAVKNPQGFENLAGLKPADFQKKYGKESYNLYNHLQKLHGKTDSGIFGNNPQNALHQALTQAITGIKQLRKLHVEMDNTVLEAYNWGGIEKGELRMENYENKIFNSQFSILNLKHDFYEVDYLPEGDNIRYTIHPEARKEILKRLLQLNHQIHTEEVRDGLVKD